MATNICESVKQALQDIVAPELRVLQTEIKRLDEKIDNVDKRFDDLKDDIRSQREEFRLAIDIHERLATLEAKIGHKMYHFSHTLSHRFSSN